METRADNEARLRSWPELTPANVASWVLANATLPNDAIPILNALCEAQLERAAELADFYDGGTATGFEIGRIIRALKTNESPNE